MYGAADSDARSGITRDYVRNSHILINLARAIGQLILLYKNVTQLAGYTARVAELREVLVQYSKEEGKGLGEGVYVENSDFISFEDVSIISPDEIPLLERTVFFFVVSLTCRKTFSLGWHFAGWGGSDLNFVVKPGMNTLIVGPNGCGKRYI